MLMRNTYLEEKNVGINEYIFFLKNVKKAYKKFDSSKKYDKTQSISIKAC